MSAWWRYSLVLVVDEEKICWCGGGAGDGAGDGGDEGMEVR